jgi:hypothetical protein
MDVRRTDAWSLMIVGLRVVVEGRERERDTHTSSVSITLSSHMICPLVGV